MSDESFTFALLQGTELTVKQPRLLVVAISHK